MRTMTNQNPLPGEELHRLLLDNGFRYVDYDEATFTGSLSELEGIIKAYADRARLRELQTLDEYMYSDQGETELDLVQSYVTKRMAQLTPKKEKTNESNE